jgi:hypothetical protein
MAMIEFSNATSKSNHLVKAYNYVHQEIAAGRITLKYITTDDQIADVLTKPLPAESHINLTNKLLQGLGGVKPASGTIATQNQIALKKKTRLRANLKKATTSKEIGTTSKTPQPPTLTETNNAVEQQENYQTIAMSAFSTDWKPPIFSFKHNNNIIFSGELQTGKCKVCEALTCIGIEYCPHCLAEFMNLEIKQTHLGQRRTRSTGLFATNGESVDTLNRENNAIIFTKGRRNILEYTGETLTVEEMHNRYRRSGNDAPNIAGPYCVALKEGFVLDAALYRCTASMANHGNIPRSTTWDPKSANTTFYTFANRIYLKTIRDIRNGDQININYAHHYNIKWYTENNYTFTTF